MGSRRRWATALTVVALVAIGGCGSGGGSTSSATTATTTAAPRTTFTVTDPTEPVVDGVGHAWFVARGAQEPTDDPVTITVADTSGTQHRTTVDLGRRQGEPTLIPTDDGALLATWSCADEGCTTGLAQVTPLQVASDKVQAGKTQRATGATSDELARPSAVGADDDRAAIQFDAFVVLASTSAAPDAIRRTGNLGDPCLTSNGTLLSVGVDVDPGATASGEVTPDQHPVDKPVMIEEFEDGAWTRIDTDEPSWADVWATKADFRCTATGPAFGTDDASATWVWDGSWRRRSGDAIDGLHHERSGPDGAIVGVIGHGVVAIDRTTGKVVRRAALPSALAEQADANKLDVRWLAIGGPRSRAVGGRLREAQGPEPRRELPDLLDRAIGGGPPGVTRRDRTGRRHRVAPPDERRELRLG